MADRYAYVPSIRRFHHGGMGHIESCQVFRICRAGLLGWASGIALAACLAMTFQQVGYWKNSEALFRRAVEVTSKNYLAYNNLGYFLSEKGKVDEALTNYLKSLEINPNYEEAQNNVGHALAQKGRLEEAIARTIRSR